MIFVGSDIIFFVKGKKSINFAYKIFLRNAMNDFNNALYIVIYFALIIYFVMIGCFMLSLRKDPFTTHGEQCHISLLLHIQAEAIGH